MALPSLAGLKRTLIQPPRTWSCDHRQSRVGSWDVAFTPGPATRQRTVNKDGEKSEWLPLLVPRPQEQTRAHPAGASLPRFHQG